MRCCRRRMPFEAPQARSRAAIRSHSKKHALRSGLAAKQGRGPANNSAPARANPSRTGAVGGLFVCRAVGIRAFGPFCPFGGRGEGHRCDIGSHRPSPGLRVAFKRALITLQNPHGSVGRWF